MSNCSICGKPFKLWMSRPIRCCGIRHDDGKTPLPFIPKPRETKSYWTQIHMYPVYRQYTWSPKDAETWYDGWIANLPNYGCGSCRKNWDKWLVDNPPDFSSARSFFIWAWRGHNFVSITHAQPRKPSIPLASACQLYGFLNNDPEVARERKWIDVPLDLESIPDNPKDKLIISVATGLEHENLLLNNSGPYMKKYADMVGADFIMLTGKTQCWWGLEKFRVRQIAEHYERTLFLDADILIRDYATDIFDVVPRGHVGMHDDYPYCAEVCNNNMEWLTQARRNMLDSQMVDAYSYVGALNSGVVLTDKEHASIWTPWENMVFPETHIDEQLWIEWLANRFPIYYLPKEFNTQWWWQGFYEQAKSAWFVHLANCPSDRRVHAFQQFLEKGNIREIDRT